MEDTELLKGSLIIQSAERNKSFTTPRSAKASFIDSLYRQQLDQHKNRRLNKRTQESYFRVIRLTLIMLALIIMIPAITILRGKFREIEKPAIIWIQNNLHFIGKLGQINVLILSTDNCQITMCCLFFYSDSLLAFKMALMFCIGQYLVMTFKFLYHEPHPYWVTQDIKFNEKMCDDIGMEYGLPSFMLFNL